MPHSRYNTITREQFEEAGFTILVESAEAGVHAAVSDDQFRRVYFQGHPEYDANSLLKEYKREVLRYFNGERDLPPFPEHYISDAGRRGDRAVSRAAPPRTHGAGTRCRTFRKRRSRPFLDNTWTDTARAIFDNWLGLVYQLTNSDRRLPFRGGHRPAQTAGRSDVTPRHAPLSEGARDR